MKWVPSGRLKNNDFATASPLSGRVRFVFWPRGSVLNHPVGRETEYALGGGLTH